MTETSETKEQRVVAAIAAFFVDLEQWQVQLEKLMKKSKERLQIADNKPWHMIHQGDYYLDTKGRVWKLDQSKNVWRRMVRSNFRPFALYIWCWWWFGTIISNKGRKTEGTTIRIPRLLWPDLILVKNSDQYYSEDWGWEDAATPRDNTERCVVINDIQRNRMGIAFAHILFLQRPQIAQWIVTLAEQQGEKRHTAHFHDWEALITAFAPEYDSCYGDMPDYGNLSGRLSISFDCAASADGKGFGKRYYS